MSASVRTVRPSWFLWLAIWTGLGAGLAEVALQAARKIVLGTYLHVSPGVAWMTPLAYALAFAPVGLLLWAAARLRPDPPLFLAGLMLGFLAALGPISMFPRIHDIAVLLLAIGLAVNGARLLRGHQPAVGRLMQATSGWMVIGIALVGAGAYGWGAAAERRAAAAVQAPPQGAPNVVLIVLDTVRAASTSAYGAAHDTTPRLSELADSGVRFEQAIAPAPWTLPTHASLFTGRLPHELNANWMTPLDATFPTLAETLAARGYATAGFVANTFYCSRESGLARGFALYDDYVISPGLVFNSSALVRFFARRHWVRRLVGYYDQLGRRDARSVNERFLTWLTGVEDRPFFAFLNYFDAHAPYLPPPPFADRFGASAGRTNPLLLYELSAAGAPPDDVEEELAAYEGAIAALDHEVGRLVDTLRERDLLRNTLVVVTSDHGEEFNEHGRMGHGRTLYAPAIRVPLVVWFPGRVPPATRVAAPVSLADVPATIMDLVDEGSGHRLAGRSLAALWAGSGGSEGFRDVVAEEEGMKAIVAGRYAYLTGGDRPEELYDLHQDPLQQRDLIEVASAAPLVACLRAVRAGAGPNAQTCAATSPEPSIVNESSVVSRPSSMATIH